MANITYTLVPDHDADRTKAYQEAILYPVQQAMLALFDNRVQELGFGSNLWTSLADASNIEYFRARVMSALGVPEDLWQT